MMTQRTDQHHVYATGCRAKGLWENNFFSHKPAEFMQMHFMRRYRPLRCIYLYVNCVRKLYAYMVGYVCKIKHLHIYSMEEGL